MYISPHMQKMSELDSYRIMLALQGQSGTGKTYGALTFPNPVVIDIDNNLVAYRDRPDVLRLPFKDNVWLKTWFTYDEKKIRFPIRDAVLKWLQTEGIKLEADQSLLLDSWSTLQDAFDQQQNLEPFITKSGGVDEFFFWERKVEYSREILGLLSQLKCNVIVSFHEQEQRTGQGELLGKIEPLMQGKFQKKLGLYFTDWFRCVAESKVDAIDKKKVIGTEYKWQVKSSTEVNLKTRMKVEDMYVPPHFDSFKQYFPITIK